MKLIASIGINNRYNRYNRFDGGLEDEPISISGGAVTTPSGFKVCTFTSDGTLTVTGSGTLYYELAAGGGGGASVRGGGGGGGALERGSMSVTAGTYAVVIGAGGAGASTSNAPNVAQNGGNTTALGITALGGGGGGSAFRVSGGLGSPNGLSGGSGGGAGPWSTGDGAGGAATSPGGFAGGAGHDDASNISRAGGGGGGAGGAGSAGAAMTDAPGGPGVASICPGVSATYCAGGKGADSGGVSPVPGANPGDGGEAAGQQAAGAAGGAGIAHFWITGQREEELQNMAQIHSALSAYLTTTAQSISLGTATSGSLVTLPQQELQPSLHFLIEQVRVLLVQKLALVSLLYQDKL